MNKHSSCEARVVACKETFYYILKQKTATHNIIFHRNSVNRKNIIAQKINANKTSKCNIEKREADRQIWIRGPNAADFDPHSVPSLNQTISDAFTHVFPFRSHEVTQERRDVQ